MRGWVGKHQVACGMGAAEVDLHRPLLTAKLKFQGSCELPVRSQYLAKQENGRQEKKIS